MVKGIYKVDIKSANVFVDESLTTKPYDVITTCECIEAACLTTNEYISAIKNISKLLKNGGHIALIGALRESSYQVGEFDFPCLNTSVEEVQEMWKSIGFTIVDSDKTVLIPPEKGSNIPQISFMYMLARKGN